MNILKKLFYKKKKTFFIYKDIIKMIDELLYKENLNDIIFSTSNRLFLLNVHYENVDEFLNSLFNKNTKLGTISISIDKFFKNFFGYIDIYSFLSRIKEILLENKELKEEFIKDLEEILTSFLFLINSEQKNERK